jgi:hypothetical protein
LTWLLQISSSESSAESVSLSQADPKASAGMLLGTGESKSAAGEFVENRQQIQQGLMRTKSAPASSNASVSEDAASGEKKAPKKSRFIVKTVPKEVLRRCLTSVFCPRTDDVFSVEYCRMMKSLRLHHCRTCRRRLQLQVWMATSVSLSSNSLLNR